MAKIRVGILFGGRSGEHEVSLLSAASVLKAIDKTKYEVVPIGITKEGRWLTAEHAERLLKGDAGEGEEPAPHKTKSICGRAIRTQLPAQPCWPRVNPWSFRRSRRIASRAWRPFRRKLQACAAQPIAPSMWMSSFPCCTGRSAKTARFRACSNSRTSPTSARACSARPRAWIKM